MAAARWLADRAFGKPPQTVEIADTQREQTATAVQTPADPPDHLKAGIRAWLLERRAAGPQKGLPSHSPNGREGG